MNRRVQQKKPLKGSLKAMGQFAVLSFQAKNFGFINAKGLEKMLRQREPVTIVDCRDDESFAFPGHIPGAVNVPYTSFADTCHKIAPGAAVVTVCYMGYYSQIAAQKLAALRHGRPLSLIGGMDAWYEAGYEVVQDGE